MVTGPPAPPPVAPPPSAPPPTARVLELAHGAAFTHILGALARLEIADHLAVGPRSVPDLADAAGADPELLDRLLRAATVLGIVAQTPAGLVALTPVGACLSSGPGSLRDFVLMLSAPGQLRPLEYLAEAISGATPAAAAAQAALGQPIWAYYREHPAEGAAFTSAMSAVSAMIAGQVAAAAAVTECRLIVDVGGGHGTILSALLARAPQARGVVFDLPEVVRTAPPAERIEFTAGDFRTSVPPGGDAYILCHVLHDWDDAAARQILAACRRAAGDGVRLLIVEAVLAERPGPLMPELLNLHLLMMSNGRERTELQFRELLDAAAWRLQDVTPLPGGQSILTALPG
jgi:O-methyltransferase domain